MWLIYSMEHSAYWKPSHNGYTKSRSAAGRYTEEEEKEIVDGANMFKKDTDEPNEAMIFDSEVVK